MRNPSIHIRRSDFIDIVQEYGLSIHDVDDIYRKASKVSIRTRVFVTTKSKGKKKVDSLVETDTNLLDQFNRIYTGCLLTHSIKSLSIGKTSPQYKTLREVCHQAKEFSDLIGMGYEEGFKRFVDTGINLLGSKFGIYRLKSAALKILEYHQARTLIETDPDPAGTDKIIVAWSTAVRTYFKTSIELEDDAQRVHFIHAREDADSMKADYYDWVYAQFEKWSYLNSVPAFSQLYGDNSKIIYEMYMAKNHKDNKTKEEQDYFTKLKKNEKTIPLKAIIEQARARKARL
jgi:hypothetical protein